jgi:uncharacterized protein YjiS (DUF1127 family)
LRPRFHFAYISGKIRHELVWKRHAVWLIYRRFSVTYAAFSAMQKTHVSYAKIAPTQHHKLGLDGDQKTNILHRNKPRRIRDMAVFETTRPLTSPAFAGGFTKLFAATIGALAVWNDERITRKALSQLSSRELDDIGLVPGDIDFVARR